MRYVSYYLRREVHVNFELVDHILHYQLRGLVDVKIQPHSILHHSFIPRSSRRLCHFVRIRFLLVYTQAPVMELLVFF